jgi:MarR-like DNA-binding transcriptional regulator SgrR of sgrS sRNA
MSLFKSIIYLIIFSFVLSGCSPKQKDDTWDVVSVWLPPEVSPSMIHGNSVFYLVRQTHEPIFRVGDNNSLYSNILKSWTRSEDYRSYNFCIKENLEFDDGISFKAEDLSKSLSLLIARYKNLKVTINKNCVNVFVDMLAKSFLDQLTSLEYSPTIKEKSTGYHLGLGPFKVTALNQKEVILKRKKIVTDGFNTIRMIPLSTNMASLNLRTIEDFNLLPVEKIPNWVHEEYSSYPVALLKVYGLVINIKDRVTRKAIFNCLNIDSFQKTYFPSEKNPVNISSVFPIGIEGASPGRVKQVCDKSMFQNFKKKFVLANWKPETEKNLKPILNDLNGTTNIAVEVKNYDPTALGDLLMNKQSEYDLMIVALDTTDEEYLPFFESFLDQRKKFHDINLNRLDREFQELKQSETKSKTVILAKKLNSELMDEAVFLPILQQTREYFFPKNLKEMNLGTNFLGYLEIGNLHI